MTMVNFDFCFTIWKKIIYSLPLESIYIKFHRMLAMKRTFNKRNFNTYQAYTFPNNL